MNSCRMCISSSIKVVYFWMKNSDGQIPTVHLDVPLFIRLLRMKKLKNFGYWSYGSTLLWGDLLAYLSGNDLMKIISSNRVSRWIQTVFYIIRFRISKRHMLNCTNNSFVWFIHKISGDPNSGLGDEPRFLFSLYSSSLLHGKENDESVISKILNICDIICIEFMIQWIRK